MSSAFLCLIAIFLLPAQNLASQDAKGTVVTLGDLQSRTPADWVEKPGTVRFHVKDFRIPAVKDDPRDAELVIFSFNGGGGSVEDNVERWKKQFLPPAGKRI